MTLKRLIMAVCLATLAGSVWDTAAQKPKLVRKPVQEEIEPEKEEDVSPAYNPLKAEKSLEIGKYYFQKKNWVAAAKRFEEALEYKPNYPDACHWLARSLEKQEKYQDAVTVLLEFENRYPESPDLDKLKKERENLEKKISSP